MWLGCHTKDKGITPAGCLLASRLDQGLVHPREVFQFALRHEPLLEKHKVKT